MKSICCTVFFLAASAWAPAANADSITFEFEGVVTFSSGIFAGATTVTGSFSYDTDSVGTLLSSPPAPPLPGHTTRFDENPGPFFLDITVSAAGHTFSSSGRDYLFQNIHMQHSAFIEPSGPTADLLVMQAFNFHNPLPTPPGEPSFFSIAFRDEDQTAFASLPATLPTALDLSEFEKVRGIVFSPDPRFVLSYDITSLRPVPEPGTLVLLGAAALGYVVRRRRRFRRRRAS